MQFKARFDEISRNIQTIARIFVCKTVYLRSATSCFRPKKNPIFFIDLVMEANTVTYSTAPESFEPSVIGCFDKGIQAAKNVPQLEKHVMERLFWSGTPLLESVGENESEVKQLREAIRNAIQRAIIPLKAYAKEYEQYLDLYNLDIKKFLE